MEVMNYDIRVNKKMMMMMMKMRKMKFHLL